MKNLYFAPINVFGNYVYRHLLLEHGADFVFSELLVVSKFGKKDYSRKFKIFHQDIEKTIFQLGVESVDEVIKGVNYLNKKFSEIKEINLNIGCPQSTMQKSFLCSGIMFHPKKMKEFVKALVDECFSFNIIPSVKMRLGTSPEDDDLDEYIKIIGNSGVKKIYVHTRFLQYNYSKPALYEKVKSLSWRFPNIEFIFNGDIDSYNRYEILACYGSKGVLVGRAALQNPLIFEQIKQKEPSRSTHYNPVENDSSLKIKEGKFVLSQRKIHIILDFINLCEESYEFDLCKKNLLYLIKGVSNHGLLADSIQKSKTFEELTSLFDK